MKNQNVWYLLLYRRINQAGRRGCYRIAKKQREQLFVERNRLIRPHYRTDDYMTNTVCTRVQEINWQLGYGDIRCYTDEEQERMNVLANTIIDEIVQESRW